MAEPAEPYEIIITDQDTPRRVPATDTRPGGYHLAGEMVSVRVSLNADHLRRVDQAAASIGVSRPDVIRAMIRQAIDNQRAEIKTRWGSSHRI